MTKLVKNILSGLGLAAYFCSTLWLTVGVPLSFTSPDENANFTFAQNFVRTGSLAVHDEVTAQLGDLAHPRSTLAIGEYIVPGGFVGLPLLAGLVGKIVGAYGLLLLTPTLLLLAILAWLATVKRLSNSRRLAYTSTILLALQPAVWYYAARTMMPNVGFVCWLIFAVWLVATKPLRRTASNFLLAGLCLGIAAAFRLSEIVWIVPAVISVVIVYRKNIKSIWPLGLLVLGFALPLLVNAKLNIDLYRQPWQTGYTVHEQTALVQLGKDPDSVDNEQSKSETSSSIASLGHLLLPFGVHPRAIIKNVWHFGLALFPWLTVLAIVGLVLALKDKGKWRQLAVGTLVLAVWLGVLYGSWSFNDNPDPTAITLGDSHLRYWLPLFVLATIFAGRALLVLAGYGNPAYSDKKSKLLLTASLGCVMILSMMLVFTGDDGLLRTRQVLLASAVKRDEVLAATEINSIIVVDRADKFLWPVREVIQPLRSETTYAALPLAVKLAPLYYLGIPLPDVDLNYLNEHKLGDLGLHIKLVETVGDEALYKITVK